MANEVQILSPALGAIMTRTVRNFPYLGRPDLSVKELDRLDGDTKDLLALLQVSVTGKPLVGASWFSYEDDELDFNSRENHLSWCVPEVEPIVREHVTVTSDSVAAASAALAKLPDDCREKLSRSPIDMCSASVGTNALIEFST